jgi:hypothetical protein
VTVYRADQGDADRFRLLLIDSGLVPEVTRYGAAGPVYFEADSTRPDIPSLAKSAGRSIRPVYTLDELR